jgi:hypothetical protein
MRGAFSQEAHALYNMPYRHLMLTIESAHEAEWGEWLDTLDSEAVSNWANKHVVYICQMLE